MSEDLPRPSKARRAAKWFGALCLAGALALVVQLLLVTGGVTNGDPVARGAPAEGSSGGGIDVATLAGLVSSATGLAGAIVSMMVALRNDRRETLRLVSTLERQDAEIATLRERLLAATAASGGGADAAPHLAVPAHAAKRREGSRDD
jgi:hypothetical protein